MSEKKQKKKKVISHFSILADSDHFHSLLLWFSAWIISQVSTSAGAEVSRYQLIPHLIVIILPSEFKRI